MPRVVAITGGKGGVGKTSVSINLAIALARTGSRVCLFDADTGLANINIMLGLYPAYTLEHLFTGEKSIQDIVIEGPEGVQIVPGASGFAQCVELDVEQQQRLVTSICSIEPHYDYMLVDTAAGISPTVLHFIAASQVATVVITPEPTSLTDAFSLLKVLRRRGYRRKVQVIVNMASGSSQAEKVYRRFNRAVAKYLDLMTEYLGAVWMDESMRTAVTLQRPVALFPKNDPSARSFYRLAERLDDVFSRPGVPKLAFSAYWQKLVERYAAREMLHKSRPEPSRVTAVSPDNQQSQSQIEKQLEDKRVETQTMQQAETALETDQTNPVQQPLSRYSEDKWLDLRVRLNHFFSDENTTPEQVTTLLSSGIYSYGSRLGGAAVDLLHGLVHTLNPDTLSDDQKRLLLADYEYLRLEGFKHSISSVPSGEPKKYSDTIISVAETDVAKRGDNGKDRYDSRGFGCQQNLAERIRNASEGIPLESLLESIKYASLVDSPDDS